MPQDYTFVATDNGVHSFTSGVTFVTSGDQTVAATDTAVAAVTGAAPLTAWRRSWVVRDLMAGWPEQRAAVTAAPLLRGDDVMRRFGLAPGPAVGALLVSLLSGPLRHVGRQGLGVVVTASLWGVAIAAFGFAQQFWLALLLLGLAGFGDQISAILRSVMLYRITPSSMLGRVSGIEFMQVAAAPSIGNLEAGALASATSLRFSIVTGGVVEPIEAAGGQ